jgi:hypothetical protein
MHSRFVSISAIMGISLLPIFWQTNANAANWFDGQEILIECPVWEWEPSPIYGIEYELCFDDIDHCTVASIGDSVCIPSLGAHDVWVTAIDYQSGDPVYYDGDIVRIERVKNADFSGDGMVGFADFGFFSAFYGSSGGPADFDEDGIVGFVDFSRFCSAYGKCVNESDTIYNSCP